MLRRSLGLLLILSLLIAPRAHASCGGELYAANGAGGNPATLFRIDPATGAITPIGPTGFALTGLAFDPTSGVLYGVTGQDPSFPRTLVTIDPASGAGTLVAPLSPEFRVSDIDFFQDGTMVGWAQSIGQTLISDLVYIDKFTGEVFVVGDSGLATSGSGLGACGLSLYLAGSGADGPLHLINWFTGSATEIATLNGAPIPDGATPALACSPLGDLYGVNLGNTSYVFQTYPFDGFTFTVAGPIDGLDALAFERTGPSGGYNGANGGFENGDFFAWETLGNASVDGGAVGVTPLERTHQALLTTGDGSVPIDDLEQFTFGGTGVLAGLGNGSPIEGSVIRKTFYARAGQVIAFEYDFLTNENSQSAYDDFAFASVCGSSSAVELADTYDLLLPLNETYAQHTGTGVHTRRFTFVVPDTGAYKLAIGVVDVIDGGFDSALIVDRVNVCEDADVDGDGILDCLHPPFDCGDGTLGSYELCENSVNPNGCPAGKVCNYCSECNDPVCGDGVISSPPEECEPIVGGCLPGDGCLPQTCTCELLPDRCAEIETIAPGGGLVSRTTAGLDAAQGDTTNGDCGNGGRGPEKIFAWTPSTTGPAFLNTCDATFDTVLYVRTDTCQAVVQDVCNDDACGLSGLGSQLPLDVVAGQTYYIVVDGYHPTSSGSFTLEVIPPQTEECGDGDLDTGEECDGPFGCSSGEVCQNCHCVPACGNGAVNTGEQCGEPGLPTCPAGQTCASCLCQIDCGDGTIDPGEVCGENGLPSCPAGQSCVDCGCVGTCGNGLVDPGEVCGEQALPDCPAGQACSACACVPLCGNGIANPGEVCGEPGLPTCPVGSVCNGCLCVDLCGNNTADAGEDCGEPTLPACAAGSSCLGCHCTVTCGNGTVDAGEQCDPQAPSSCTPGTGCAAPSCQCEAIPNRCAQAIMIPDEPPVVPITGQTSGPSAIAATCGAGGTGPEQIFKWTAPRSGTAIFETCGSGFDTILYVRAGSCTGASYACNDDAQCGSQSNTQITVDAGQTYYVVVDGARGESGQFQLTVVAPPIPPFSCGDGFVGSNEVCDATANPTGCQTGATCTGCNACQAPRCGDGTINRPEEQCDDGNLANGDCCSATCTREPEGNICRSAKGMCDAPERCPGPGQPAECPAQDAKLNGTVCRDGLGDCNPQELCDGHLDDCPADVFAPPTASCSDGDECTEEDRCVAGGTCNPGNRVCDATADSLLSKKKKPKGILVVCEADDGEDCVADPVQVVPAGVSAAVAAEVSSAASVKPLLKSKTRRFKGSGSTTLKLNLTPKGKQVLKNSGGLDVTVTVKIRDKKGKTFNLARFVKLVR